MKQRVMYMDCLRLCAILGVVICHVQGQYEFKLDVASVDWQILNFYNCIVRGSLGILVMISGALFLSKKPGIEYIYKKSITKIVIAFFAWSAGYALIDAAKYGNGMKEIIIDVIRGHVHLWYLFMIVGLYIVTPLLYKIVENKILMRYFLVLSFVFLFLVPQAITVASSISDALGEALGVARNNANINFVLGYVFYYVLGYYLSVSKITKRAEGLIYIAGVVGFVSTITGTLHLSLQAGIPVVSLQTAFTVNVMLEALAVFVFFKQHICLERVGEKAKSLIAKLSKYSFGVYLVHIMVLDQVFNRLGIDAMMFHPLIAVPITSLGVFSVSMVVSVVLNKIPTVKYIV